MALSIKSEEADRLARELADRTGESITTAVEVALRERLQRERSAGPGIADRLRRLAQDTGELPVEDGRTPEEIVGYDQHGLPA